MTMILVAPAYAASPRAIMVTPDITFNGVQAECSVRITANNASDKIEATMELWQGTTFIDSWNGSGQWTLKLKGTADVIKNETYTLIIDYTVNGIVQTQATFTKENG